MDRTKQKLLDIGNEKALKKIVNSFVKAGGSDFSSETVRKEVLENLKVINADILIADEDILKKAEAKEPLNAMEEEQLADLNTCLLYTSDAADE